MKRLFLFALGLCCVHVSLAQLASFELPLELSDGTSTISMRIAMQEGASDGIDSGLDRIAPPPPPADFLEAYIVSNAGSLWHDYRGLTADTVRFAVFIDPNDGLEAPIILRWDDTVDLATLGSFRVRNALETQEALNFDMAVVDSLNLSGMPDVSDGVIIEVVLGASGTSVGTVQDELPRAPQLLQNYPNPFQSATTIGCDVPHAGDVDLRVFDALGREVDVLAKGRWASGRHYIQWQPEGLPSGTYFYRLRTQDASGQEKTLSRRMVLIR